MKTFKFQFPDHELKCELPENWEEMTVKQAIALNLKTFNNDPLEAIERLAGVEPGKLRNTQIEEKHKKALAVVTNFLASPPADLMERKHLSHLEIKGKTIKIPSDLLKESFGQYSLFQQLVDHERALSMIMAVYLQPLLDGDYKDMDRVEELSHEIDQMNFLEIFPIVNFFFHKWSKYKVYGKPELIAFQ